MLLTKHKWRLQERRAGRLHSKVDKRAIVDTAVAIRVVIACQPVQLFAVGKYAFGSAHCSQLLRHACRSTKLTLVGVHVE